MALRLPARQHRRQLARAGERAARAAVPPRLVVAIVLAFLPIFAANLVFASRFRDTVDSTAAFGANLLGAMVGGLLEYTSLVFGYRNLLLLVAALYGAAFLLRPRQVAAERSLGRVGLPG